MVKLLYGCDLYRRGGSIFRVSPPFVHIIIFGISFNIFFLRVLRFDFRGWGGGGGMST